MAMSEGPDGNRIFYFQMIFLTDKVSASPNILSTIFKEEIPGLKAFFQCWCNTGHFASAA